MKTRAPLPATVALLLLSGLFALSSTVESAELEVMYEWPVLQFDTPFNYPIDPDYLAETTVVTGIEIGWDRVFVTAPRIWKGNPATVGWVPRAANGFNADKSPNVQAYPSWDWHANAASGNPSRDNCTGIVSVFRVRADRCNRLWVLDSGVQDSLVTFTVACPPKILIFDMQTDTLVRTIAFPAEVLRPNSLLTNFVLDQPSSNSISGAYGSCDNGFVYISDTTNPGVVVVDASRDTSWRISHPTMYPDPDFGTFSYAGETFSLMDGVIGLAVSPPSGRYRKNLYYQAFASDRLYSIPVSVLQRGPNQGDDADLPVSLVGHKSSQAAGLAFDPKDGSLLFSPVSETAIAAWVPNSPEHKVVAFNPDLLQFVLDIRPAERDNDNMWLVSSRLQKFFRRTISRRENNLRVMRIVPDDNLSNNSLLFH